MDLFFLGLTTQTIDLKGLGCDGQSVRDACSPAGIKLRLRTKFGIIVQRNFIRGDRGAASPTALAAFVAYVRVRRHCVARTHGWRSCVPAPRIGHRRDHVWPRPRFV